MSNPTLGPLAEKDDWQTPQWVTDGIADHIGGFDCDPCPGERTTVGEWNYWLSIGLDGLKAPWRGDVFVNPPFSHKSEWVERAIQQYRENDAVDRVFLLTPDSTDVRSWFHSEITEHASYVWFADGRVKFREPHTGESAGSPSFGTMISVFGAIPDSLKAWFNEHGFLVEQAMVDPQTQTYTVTD